MAAQIRRATLDEVIDLRHEVLRHGLAREAAVFAGDREPAAIHYGAFEGERLVGCATLHPSRWDGEPAWQLRGMAVAQSSCGQGVGRELLQFIEREMEALSPGQLLWCNARLPASGFYEKLGWRRVSEVFEIPTAGPHLKMIKRLARA